METGRVERKLTAILAADVVQYSRLMGVDDEETLRRLTECRRELVFLHRKMPRQDREDDRGWLAGRVRERR